MGAQNYGYLGERGCGDKEGGKKEGGRKRGRQKEREKERSEILDIMDRAGQPHRIRNPHPNVPLLLNTSFMRLEKKN